MSLNLRQYHKNSREQFIMKLMQRRAACTHIRMARLFDPDNKETCDLCYKTPTTGWIYCCVQDHDGFIPDPEMLCDEHNKTLRIPLSVQDSTRFLSASVRKGIQEGNYCEEQVQVLVAQKRRVKDVIESLEAEMEEYEDLAVEDELQDPEEGENADESSGSSSVSSSESVRGENQPTSAVEEEEEDVHIGNAIQQEEAQSTTSPNNVMKPTEQARRRSLSPKAPFQTIFTTLKKPALPLTPPCLLKCCQRCRPAYRDRAAQPIDEILLAPITPWPPTWDFANRPISNARALRQGGPLPADWELRYPYQTFEASNNILVHDTISWSGAAEDAGSISNTAEADVSTESSSSSSSSKARSRWGIRRSVRRSLNTLSLRLKPNTNISDPPPPLLRRFLTKRRRPTSLPQAFSRDNKIASASVARSPSIPIKESMSDRINNNPHIRASLALLLAMNTPLPGAGEDECNLAGGELKVEEVRVGGGVAVKEEAVAMGVPDLITQV